MMYCGIDIGLSGGIAFLNETGGVACVEPMPIKIDAHGKKVVHANMLMNILSDPAFGTVGLAAFEYVHSFGHESRSSIFSFGRSAGRTQAVVELCGLSYIEPTPQMWKSEVLAGTKKDKAAAIGWCNARWPSLEVKHDGIADALCLAEYARRQVVGK